MLHVRHATALPVPDHVFRAMFAARKSVFVDLLKWDVPVLDGRYEVDQFDDDHAVYIILADKQGGHLGSARLLPTTRPHILDGLYPFLCEDGAPTGPTTYEITRFCLDRRLRATERRAVRDTLVHALVDHALAHGVTRYTAIAELTWFQQILAFGWRCMPLGLPQRIDGTMLAALSIAIDRDTPRLLEVAGISPDRGVAQNDELAAA
ncbi:acyl-homoserine-lactone synthase [Sphingomonas pruni]|uniref:acyl-homoserine-lactone synthase n=1 Tax=Sphingomonas pruni TaxID=40683 RepID=UPI00083089AC|nr:acyl-homoserine-lactone synthase [Sphingomonas pruni]